MSLTNAHHPEPAAHLILRGEVSQTIELRSFPFVIGRSANADLQLADSRISREHAIVEHDAEGYFLRDHNSRHGTLVNGQPLISDRRRLQNHDAIVLGGGGTTLIFQNAQEQTIALSSLARPPEGSSNELERLTLFLKAAQSLSGEGALDEMLGTMLEYTLRLTSAERGFVFLGSDPQALRLGRGQNRLGVPQTDFTGVSRSVMRQAVLSARDFLIDDVAAPGAPSGQQTLELHAIRSVAAIPLRGAVSGQLLGLLYLDSQSSRHHLGQTDQAILHAIARQAALLLENFRMLEQEREAASLRKELSIAAEIQRQILPQTLPRFAGLSLAARSVPCAGVGGDFYDVIPVPDGFIAVLADVCGKGIPAALLAAVAHGMLYAQIGSGVCLREALEAMNTFICARSPQERYLTLVALHYQHGDPGPAQVSVINCGHVLPLVVRAGGVIERHQGGNLPVGLIASASCQATSLQLYPGDRIVLLSDGITEAENPEGCQFEDFALATALQSANPLQTVFAALESFSSGAPPQDDQTILIIERLIQ